MSIWNTIRNKLSNTFNGTQNNENTIMKKMYSNKTFNINNPTSYRTFHKGDDGTYSSGSVDVGITNAESSTDVQGIASTCVKNVKYNPKKEIATVTFQGGKKDYDYKVSPNEMKDFVNATSKGRHINKVWKYNNHI